jgi:hypothetical protein
MATSTPEMSQFLLLPTKLRHQILSFLIQLRSRSITTCNDGLYYHINAVPLKILLTCKILHTDATDILCRLNQKLPHIMTCVIYVMLKCIKKRPFTLAQQLTDTLHFGPSVRFCRNSAHHALRDHILKTVFEKRKGSVVCSTFRRKLSVFLAKYIHSSFQKSHMRFASLIIDITGRTRALLQCVVLICSLLALVGVLRMRQPAVSERMALALVEQHDVFTIGLCFGQVSPELGRVVV